MQTKICQICNKEFKAKNKWQKFCSYKCANKNKETCKDIECPTCHKIFHQKMTVQKYCSTKCIPHYRPRKLQDIICPICKKEFHPIRARQQCCSPECRIEFTKAKLKDKRASYTATEKDERIKKRTSEQPKMKSKTNIKYWNLLERMGYTIDCYDFLLWWKYYDIKIWNILIEINPYSTHNTVWMPRFANGCSPHSNEYHYEKCNNAINNWYKYINIRDWTTEWELIDMLEKDFIYKWKPNLHRYNPRTKEHLLDEWYDKEEMLEKGYLSIYDSWTIYFSKELQCS